MLSARPSTLPRHPILLGLLTALALAALLVAATMLRYPGAAGSPYLVYGVAALGALLCLASGMAARGGLLARDDPVALRFGTAAGLAFGFLWVVEISFNNFVPPEISTAASREVVDNAIWAAILAGTVAVSALSAGRARRFASGVRAGLWSGLVSGLVACLMGLLLVVAWMGYLLRDPLNAAEYARQGFGPAGPDPATYLAYETMAGALGHLLLLGIGAGVMLGALGGLAGKGLARRSSGDQQR